jgi:hypothetical protein
MRPWPGTLSIDVTRRSSAQNPGRRVNAFMKERPSSEYRSWMWQPPYQVERTSLRAGASPAEVQRLRGAMLRQLN